MALAAAVDLLEVTGLLGASRIRRSWSMGLLTLSLAVWPLSTFSQYLSRTRGDTRTEAEKWILANQAPGSLIAIEPNGPDIFGPLELWPLESELREKILETPSMGLYGVQRIPLFQAHPHLSEVFYDLNFYASVDLFITTSTTRGRYEKDRERFRRQNEFYERLDQEFQKVAEFKSEGGSSPGIVLYKNPRHATPFANRTDDPGPAPMRPSTQHVTGEEAFFYYNLGLNYETFKLCPQAIAAYEMGMRVPLMRPHIYSNSALGTWRCLRSLGRIGEASAFLEKARAGAPHAEDRQLLDLLWRQARE
jgi:hypothetical protein